MKKNIRIAVVFILAAACAANAQARRKFTPEDVLRFHTASDPQVSPDGKLVAYVVTATDEAKNKHVSSVWVVPADGSGPAKPFIDDVSARSPLWSPDGKSLAFISGGAPAPKDKDQEPGVEKSPAPASTPKNQVWQVGRDGGERRELTHFAGGVSAFAWSPDGTELAVVARTSARPRDVKNYTSMFYKVDGAGWSNGTHNQIWIVSLKDSKPRQLTTGDDADDKNPKWSPDGKWIAYLSSDANADLREVNGLDAIMAVPVSGGEPRTIHERGMYVGAPAWSPDSKQLAYGAAPTPADQPLLWIAPFDNPSKASLASDVDLFPLEVEWNAAGLWFAAHDHGASPMFRVDPATHHAVKVLAGNRAYHDLDVSEVAHRLVYVENDDTHPHNIFTAEFDGSHERQLTFQNRELMSQVEVAPTEELTWKGADGLTIQGFLKRPIGWQPGHKYPMILAIHGGPNGMFGYHWEFDEQLYAADGYAVLLTNPRGSSGYGTKFQRAVANQWGGKAYDDIMHGVEAALAKYPWIDRQRLGVIGHSYGGFMTDWIVTQTNVFKAAISVAGISDFISVEATRDAAYGHARDFGGDLYTNFPEFWKYSSVRLAGNVHTPILFLHGEADNRVPVSQSEEYFRAIKHFGGNAELVIFPRESHMLPLNAEPKHLVDTYRWRLYWFDRYVKGNEQAQAPDAATSAAGN